MWYIKPRSFIKRLDMVYEKKKGVRDDFQVLSWATRKTAGATVFSEEQEFNF